MVLFTISYLSSYRYLAEEQLNKLERHQNVYIRFIFGLRHRATRATELHEHQRSIQRSYNNVSQNNPLKNMCWNYNTACSHTRYTVYTHRISFTTVSKSSIFLSYIKADFNINTQFSFFLFCL